MVATIHRLRSKADRLKREQAEKLAQHLLQFPELEEVPERAVGRILAALDQVTAADDPKGWSFVMISPAQNNAVVDWLSSHSKRPIDATRLWAKLFTAMRSDTGEVMLTRVELADQLGIHENNVSAIMSELVKIGAIITKREKVAGMRGPGMVRYFMNPRVATHISTSAAREKAQAAAPPLLVLMEGGTPGKQAD